MSIYEYFVSEKNISFAPPGSYFAIKKKTFARSIRLWEIFFVQKLKFRSLAPYFQKQNPKTKVSIWCGSHLQSGGALDFSLNQL